MNCVNHPEAPAVAYCRECGKALCETCRRQADGTIYCDEHAPAAAPPAQPPPPPPPASPYTAPEPTPYHAPEPSPYTTPETVRLRPPTSDRGSDRTSGTGASPGLAFLLGFIPGVGAIYNGQYVKGLVHVVVLGVLISLVSSDQLGDNLEPLFGMMIAVWVFYMAFEAYHTAKRRQLGQPVDEFSSIVPRHGQPARFPLAPTVLIAVGVIFLLHNLNILRIGELIRYWPVALICLGAYMLYERLSGPPGAPGGYR
jgi:TM2 domain-containing membrane protein YozV